MIPEILFENESFIVIDKPAGWLSVPGRAGDRDSRSCARRALEASGVARRALPVHRLDCEASGLLLFAKNADAHRAANAWFEKHQIAKVYEAWTEGSREGEAVARGGASAPVEWRSRLLRGKRRAYESPAGKEAVTRARWLGRASDGLHRWRLEPLTGRSHQLRFELARHGFPIAGDALYGATREFGLGSAIALRAVELGFERCASASRLGLPERLSALGLEGTVKNPMGARA